MRSPEEARIRKLEERNEDLHGVIEEVINQLRVASDCYQDEEYVKMHDFVITAEEKLVRASRNGAENEGGES